jgi:hypothetical protein
MTNRMNPWGPNWHNENYTSGEMDDLLGKIFGPKCIFMGFLPAGKRKWVRTRPDGTMEVIKLYSDGALYFLPFFGLSFPWIPHAVSESLRWHKTPKSATMDLQHQHPSKVDWKLPRQRTLAAEQANKISTEVCEACESWFARLSHTENFLEELERRRAAPGFHNSVQILTVYQFWQARIGKWRGFDDLTKRYLTGYFSATALLQVEQLLKNEMECSRH